MSDFMMDPREKPTGKVEVPNFDGKLTQGELNWIALQNSRKEDEEGEDEEE